MSNRTVTDIAQEAMKNFDEMSERMASIANGNSKHSRSWPCEEDLFPPLRKYLNKNRELKKELERLYANVL